MNSSIVVTAGIVAVIATIIVMVAGRKEPDTERQRTFARYVDSVNLLSVFVALFAGYAVVAQLTRFVIPEDDRFGSGPGLLDVATGSFSGGFEDFVSRGNDSIWRGAVQAGLLLLVACLILTFHRRQRQAMIAWEGFDPSAGARVDQAYRYAVCFVAVFVILMAGAFGLFAVFRIAAPGIATGSSRGGQRAQGVAQALSLLALGAGALVVFRVHWTDTMLRLRPGSRAAPTPTGTDSVVDASRAGVRRSRWRARCRPASGPTA